MFVSPNIEFHGAISIETTIWFQKRIQCTTLLLSNVKKRDAAADFGRLFRALLTKVFD